MDKTVASSECSSELIIQMQNYALCGFYNVYFAFLPALGALTLILLCMPTCRLHILQLICAAFWPIKDLRHATPIKFSFNIM